MARIDHLISYDICDPKRLIRVHRAVSGFGVRLQYSVYLCTLTPRGLQLLRNRLHELIHHEHDRVLFIALGPRGRYRVELETMGQSLPDLRDKDPIL